MSTNIKIYQAPSDKMIKHPWISLLKNTSLPNPEELLSIHLHISIHVNTIGLQQKEKEGKEQKAD